MVCIPERAVFSLTLVSPAKKHPPFCWQSSVDNALGGNSSPTSLLSTFNKYGTERKGIFYQQFIYKSSFAATHQEIINKQNTMTAKI